MAVNLAITGGVIVAMINIAILVTSDSRGGDDKPDLCIPAITEFLAAAGFAVVHTKIVKDEVKDIQRQLKSWSADDEVNLILTSGGTGVSPRDVTPEATKPLLTKELVGIAEAMRAYSMQKTVNAALSRAVAGLIGQTPVINLPGSPKAAVENLEPIYKMFEHLVKKAAGDSSDCAGSGDV